MSQLSIHSRWHSSHSGFTLVELMVVVVIMGIVSVSVIPAMNNISSMREGAARDDLVRYMNVARGRATASGVAHGLQINLSDSSLTIVKVNSLGSVEVVIDPLTSANRTINLSDLYSGVTISAMVNGDGEGGSGIVWFDFESNPMTYDAGTQIFTISTQSATITLSSDEQVVVYPYTGTLEVQ